MERKIKTAVVGCGMISNIYIKNLKNLFSIIDLVAVGNRSRAAAEEKAGIYGIDRVMTIDEIAASDEIELVVNLTPAYAHYDIIKKMLLSGKHVWTEKTMTATLDEARELVKIAEEKGLYLGVAPDTVLGAGLQTARRAIETDMIGTISSGIVVINRNQALNSEYYTFLRGEGGSLPYDVGVYYIAALLSLLGPVKAIRAFGAPAPLHTPEFIYAGAEEEPWQIPGSNVISASLQFECGALVSVLFDGNTVNAPQHNITLFGSRGILKIGDPNTFNGPVSLIYADQPECTLPFTHGYNGVNTIEESPFDFYGHRGVGVAEMAYAIRAGRPNRCSKEYGLHCLEVLAGMEESAATGKTIEPASRFEMRPLAPGYFSSFMGGQGRADAERSLMD
ncbi:MAG: Gfo/Idh/MocA family oxidoreductase [Lachnospiraceae bacterium]|nr:Gfo/Idh/MocA family oxidoreductase [Lachnospiraceae bacterium]